jgi:tetratricopeptide (TPR) repeat protein
MYVHMSIIAAMRSPLYRVLILLTVLGLIFTPPVLTGYSEQKKAETALKVNDISFAAHAYERAARLLPWSTGLWEQAGQLEFKLGAFDKAISLLEKAQQEDSLSGSGWDILGIAYLKQSGDLNKTVSIWKTGSESYPSYSLLYSHLALAYYEQGDLSAEQTALERWVASGGDQDSHAYYRLGLLLSASDPERALQEFLSASSLDSRYDSVVETMRTTLNLALLETSESRQLVIIGRGLGLVNEWTLAERAFRQAVAADGENAEAWAWLGEAEQQLGQDGRAESDKALSLEYKNPIVRSLRGLYWMRQGQPAQALNEYKLAATYDPDNPAWQISIGGAYAKQGDLQAALGSYQRATQIAPTDAKVWRSLAAFSAQYNMQVEDVGLPAARKAVDLNGEDPQALDMLGWTLALLERYDQAQDALEHALRLDPELAQGHLHLGIVAIQKDEWESARDHLQQARNLDPDGPVGKQAQLLLNQYFP